MTDQELAHQLLMIQKMVAYYERSDGKTYLVVLKEEEPQDGCNPS